jgi:hypothetical protein
MGSVERVSNDGSWKIVVAAWQRSFIIYSEMGVSTSVYERGQTSWWDRLWGVPAGWVPANANVVRASGSLSARTVSPASSRIPGSPDMRTNASAAECKAWAFGGGVSFPLDGGAITPGRGPTSHLADFVEGSGSATRGAETLTVERVTFPP